MSLLLKWLLIFTLLFGVGFLRSYLYYGQRPVDFPHEVSFKVSQPPNLSGSYQKIMGKVNNYPGSYTALVEKNIKVSYGNVLTLSDYRYENGTIFWPQVKVTPLLEQNRFLMKVFAFREGLATRVSTIFPEPYGWLFLGITFGIDQIQDPTLEEQFRQISLVHILVASGFNISLIIGAVGTFGKYFKPGVTSILTLVAVFTFILISGLQAPVIRAAIMGGATLLATHTGNRKDGLLWLVFAAVGMLVVDPALVFGLSFQLSFLATLGIILLSGRLERLFYLFPGLLRGDLATSIAAQLFVSPLLWLTFKQFNPVSLLVNGLVLWTVPYIVGFGAFGLGVSLVSVGLAMLAGVPCQVLLSYMIWVVNIFT